MYGTHVTAGTLATTGVTSGLAMGSWALAVIGLGFALLAVLALFRKEGKIRP